MKLIALMCGRNEDWICALSLRAALMWNDEIICLLHACTDKTAEIVEQVALEYPGRIHILIEDNPVWEEMRHRARTLDAAREHGATHLSIVDFDEVLSANLVGVIRDVIRLNCRPGTLLQLPWACIARGGTSRYYTDGVWFDNWVSTAFLDSPRLGWTSASRGGYDFHHRHPMGQELDIMRPIRQKGGGLMHLQFASERRVRAKQAAYKIQEVLRWPNKRSARELNAMYGRAVHESNPKLIATEQCPESWWAAYSHLMQYLDVDAEPWQELWVREQVAQHGREAFKDLDLFGVVE